MKISPEEQALYADASQAKLERQQLNPAETAFAIQRGLTEARTRRNTGHVQLKWMAAVLVTALAAGWLLLGPLDSSSPQQATYSQPTQHWGVLEPFRKLVETDMEEITITSALNNGYVQLVDRTVTSGIYEFTVNAVMADENRIIVLYTAKTNASASQEIYSIVNAKMTDALTGDVIDNGRRGGIHISNDKHTIYGRDTIERNRNKPLPEQVKLQFQISSVVPQTVADSESEQKERKYKYSKKMDISFDLDPKFSVPKTEMINVNRSFTIGGYKVLLSQVELSPLVTRVKLVYEPDKQLDYKTLSSISGMVSLTEIITTAKDGRRTELSSEGGGGTDNGMMYFLSSNLLDDPQSQSMVLKLQYWQEAEKKLLEFKIK
ncbi:DUF4179 domain-containing protein [Paenibacillus sp. QZ-Y1]|uniref:DUF4179 domain-containing protein n=1 Tax=Paenibacillus sp. QZ-Y1 TaxID=3414511 RepID=UPI003F7B1CFD